MKKCLLMGCSFLTILNSCIRKNEYKNSNAQNAASEYCSCIDSLPEHTNLQWAIDLCRVKIAEKYKYYKVFYYDMHDSAFNNNMSKSEIESIQNFMSNFDGYLQTKCTTLFDKKFDGVIIKDSYH